jgi:glutamate carboxypeptidase
MKGGLVMALHALDVLFARGVMSFSSIRFVLVSDEELGSPKNRTWIEDNARQSDWVLVLEPTRPGGGMITSRGAVGAFFIDASGISAHAAVNYAKGASAIRELAAMVGPLERLSSPEVGMIVNVGTIQGGSARQVIPPYARLALDVRARDSAQVAALEAAIAGVLAEKQDPRVSVELSGGWTRPLFPRNEGTAALFTRAGRIASLLGIPCLETPTTSGGSDGSFCAALGIPTLDGMGPVCFDVCSREEAVPIASFAERGAIFAALIADLANQLQS